MAGRWYASTSVFRTIKVQAWQWRCQPKVRWPKWLTARYLQAVDGTRTKMLEIAPYDSELTAAESDWVLRSHDGTFRVMDHDLFRANYKPVKA